MAATWRIIIDRNVSEDANDESGWERRVVVIADSRYLIDEDMTAWVRAELDPSAAIYVAPNVTWHHFDLPGRMDLPNVKMHTVCEPCLKDEHGDCSDSGIKSYPYWCACAAHRHNIGMEYNKP